ncbi:MAG: hypothetical protein ACKO39_04115 [Chthoniobacterales bacterium]
MNTTASSQAAHQLSFYRFEDLRPFSNELTAYALYALQIRRLRAASANMGAMARALKKSSPLRAARSAAQSELQRVYDHVAFGLRMPKLPVRLPLRKRLYRGGAAVIRGNDPQEIRIFPLAGSSRKNRRKWQPADVGVIVPSFICEILLHEIAHVHQGFFTGQWDHEHGFARSYHVVEEVFLGFGFGPLLPREYRFAGCPPGSFAASLQGTPRQSKSLAIGINGDHAAKP